VVIVMFQDLRYALRMMRQSPVFTATALATLALGIGASTAIFGVIDNLFFRPPDFQHVDRLVAIADTNPEKVPPDASPPPSPGNVLDWRERMRSFDAIAMWRNWYYAIGDAGSSAGPPESVRGVRVSPAFFRMLGVDALAGRTFREADAIAGADRVAVLSHRLWVRRFGADPAVVGRRVLVDARPFVVVGVLPDAFQFYQPDLDLWMPLAEDAGLRDRTNHSVQVFARLAPGVSLAQAQRELDAVARQLEIEHPDTNAGWGARLVPLYPSREVRDLQPALIALLAASGFVLLIACVNIANLLLGRALARQREIAIRAAIGASRARLVRQMLTESVLLAIGGGAAGVVVAWFGGRWLTPLLPHAGTNHVMGTFAPIAPALDVRVAAFSIATACLTSVAFGLVPAVHASRPEMLRVAAASPERRAAGKWLMAAELTLAIVLLVASALLVKSAWRLQHVDPGFRPDHLLTLQLGVSRAKYPGADEARRFYDRLLQRIGQIPGVRGAGAISFRPFLGMAMTTRVDVDGRAPRSATDEVFVGFDVVTPGFVRVLGQRLLRGRDLAPTDTAETLGVAVVNETMARQLWPDTDPIGRQIRPAFSRTDVPWAVDSETRALTVVGVTADIKEFRLNEPPRPLMYISNRQFPSWLMYVLIRTEAAAESVAPAVQRELRAVDPDAPASGVQTMERAIDDAMPRFSVSLLVLFAAIAWLLSTIGVYGVTSHGVAQRTREIGIRLALGASATDMVAMVMRETIGIAVVAAGVGLAGAIGGCRAITGLLYGVAPTDAGALGGAAGVLLSTVLVAALWPARRAARVDPATALRSE
jgi:putative ABC transport system permease protein